MADQRNDPCGVLSDEDFEKLRRAVDLLEAQSLATRLMSSLGKGVERSVELLPAALHGRLTKIVTRSLSTALRGALLTMDSAATGGHSRDRFHKALVTASGAAGGLTGLAGAAIELPISSGIMLRSIADIARSHGEDLTSEESKLSCLQVFALGGPDPSDDAAETGYWSVRLAFARTVEHALKHAASQGLANASAPALIRFIERVAERFGIAVTQKFAAQALPVVGGVAGAAVNYAFMDHFQDTARGHFTVRSLERTYGSEAVKGCYQRISEDRNFPDKLAIAK